MEPKANETHKYSYEEFEPFCKWQRKEDRDILEIHLPDFKKEQLKVQISNHGMLKISGERLINASRKSKFCKEYQISSKYDASAIHAKFVNGYLIITMILKKEKVQQSQIDPTSKPEPNKSEPLSSPNKSVDATKEQTQASTGSLDSTMCEFQDPKISPPPGRKLAKVVVILTATAAVATILIAYVVYMYKAYAINEINGCTI